MSKRTTVVLYFEGSVPQYNECPSQLTVPSRVNRLRTKTLQAWYGGLIADPHVRVWELHYTPTGLRLKLSTWSVTRAGKVSRVPTAP